MKQFSHQDRSEDRGADAVGHLKLSFFIGPCEVVLPPRTKHPGSAGKMRNKHRSFSLSLEPLSRSLPSQHGVRLSCEDCRIHHKSCIVHDQRHPFSQSQSAAMPLFTAEVIHVNHITGSLSQGLGVVVHSWRTQRPRDVSPGQGSSMRIRKRNPGGSWAGGPRG